MKQVMHLPNLTIIRLIRPLRAKPSCEVIVKGKSFANCGKRQNDRLRKIPPQFKPGLQKKKPAKSPKIVP